MGAPLGEKKTEKYFPLPNKEVHLVGLKQNFSLNFQPPKTLYLEVGAFLFSSNMLLGDI